MFQAWKKKTSVPWYLHLHCMYNSETPRHGNNKFLVFGSKPSGKNHISKHRKQTRRRKSPSQVVGWFLTGECYDLVTVFLGGWKITGSDLLLVFFAKMFFYLEVEPTHFDKYASRQFGSSNPNFQGENSAKSLSCHHLVLLVSSNHPTYIGPLSKKSQAAKARQPLILRLFRGKIFFHPN